MSVQAMAWALDHSRSRGSNLLVLISIANHCGKYGENAYPSHPTIGAEARVSRNTVIGCIDDLEALGEIVVYVGEGRVGRGGTTNRYEMPLVPGWTPPKGLEPRKPFSLDTSSEIEAARSTESKPRDPESKAARSEPKAARPIAREPSLEPSIFEPSKEEPPTAHSVADAFEAWWLAYPARDGRTRGDKKRARAAWGKLSAADRAKAEVAVVHYAAGTDSRFVKNAEGWLGARYFDDWQTPGRPRARDGLTRVESSVTGERADGPARRGVWSDD